MARFVGVDAVRRVLANSFFGRADGNLSTLQTIGWWEARRIPFNLAVGVAGVVSGLIVLACEYIIETLQHVSAGPMPDPPFFLVIGVFAYAIAANLCYTLGWVAEIAVRELWQERAGAFGPISFVLGLGFSIVLSLLPGLLVVIVTIIGLMVGPGYWAGS